MYGIVIVSRMFQGHFQGVSANVIGDLWVLKGISKGVSRVFHECFKLLQESSRGF